MSGSATRLWTVEGLAEYLGVPVNTVYRWRTLGKAPAGVKVGRHVRFTDAAVQTWLREHADTPQGTAA